MARMSSNFVEMQSGIPVVFFDDPCGLCQTCVRLLLRLERPHSSTPLHFSPLQGKTASSLLPAHLRSEPLEGLVFRNVDGVTTVGVDAIRDLSKYVRWPWRWAFAIFPGPVYRRVAPHRSRFGFPTCAIDARLGNRWLP